MPRRRTVVLAAYLCALTVWGLDLKTASAGIPNTPLPQFSDGTPSVLVLAVPGVVKKDRLQTDFLCTSLEGSPVDIGVEVFTPDGTLLNDIHAGEGALLNVGTGQTVTIGTKGTTAYLESAVIPLPGVSQGSARVVATSDRVRCNVIVLDDAVSPPVAMATLGEGFRPVPGSVLPNVALPQFADGQPAGFAALVPGVIKKGPMQSSFLCTSLAAGNIDIGVEMFGPDGTIQNNINTGNGAVLNVPPGATVTLSTSGTAGLLETTVITSGGVAQGVARIVSTSGNVVCTALVLDATVTPPASMSSLFGSTASASGDVNRDGAVNAADVPALIKEIFP